ncbi:MAG: hypothetical protein ABIJ04_11905 [Bacteroidota bacterium]
MTVDIIFLMLMIIQWIILVYLAFGTLYIFVFATASLFHYHPGKAETEDLNRIAVMIPGYKEDAVILEVADDALQQKYPK